MKKAAIIVSAVIYVIAILIVAFLGYEAEIKNPPVYADEIVMKVDTPYEHYGNGVLIYTITRSKLEEDPEEQKYTYDVEINDFEFLYYVLGAEIDLGCKPISHKIDENTGERLEPKEQGLNYYCSSKQVTVTEEGKVTFLVEKDDGSYDLVVSTKDGSNISIYIHIYW